MRAFRSLFPVLLLSLSAAVSAASDPASLRSEAIRLYDAGDYAGALVPLTALDEAGAADGAMLYRLQFCQAEAGSEEARKTLRRAIEQLESEAGESLEATFYLANAYRNVAKNSAAAEIAKSATDRLESGDWPEPTDGLDAFRYGKLYADQDRADKATQWFQRALERLDEAGSAGASYAQWARRYLAEQAAESGDPRAERQALTSALAAGNGTQQQWDRLAVLQAQDGELQEASKSWGKALIANPATGNRARYAQRVSLSLHDLGGATGSTPDGQAWSALDQGALEQTMMDSARRLAELKQSAEPLESLTRERAREINRELQTIRPTFLTAAIEYILRGYPLREMAFQAGIAPLFFRSSEWNVSRPLKAKGKGRQRPN